ncbi:MAG: FliI/YscN family ATPase [Candidatus Nealsonbacteria bacterium]|nr:FliI/YscN family ATPase [Candidatus Nealsonbacteria bacterium]
MLNIAEQLETVMPTALTGTVASTVGMTVSVAGFPAPVGATAEIRRETGEPLRAEVIGFRDGLTVLYPRSNLTGVRHGHRVRLVQTAQWLRVGDALLGRVIDASGKVVDGRPQPGLRDRTSFVRQPPHPCTRPRIDRPLATGVRTIDGLLTCGKGQRMGIFAGSGVGKSVLLGMMARYTSAEVIVIALIGERGREVNEFLERDLGKDGLSKSVVVVATSDEPALVRVQAASTATAIAEYFRDQGKDVLLMMDSLTRFAFAQREIGLAAGEPPTSRGYPPSVFALLPKLVERAGRSPSGSITAFYSVLVEADDPNEPISDAVRGLLDGHTWLSRSLASRGHYPAIDVLESLSRLMPDVTDEAHRQAAFVVRELLAAYRDHEDLISIGAYRKGTNRSVDVAVDLLDDMNRYLRQPVEQPSTFDETREGLKQLFQKYSERVAAQVSQPELGSQATPQPLTPNP